MHRVRKSGYALLIFASISWTGGCRTDEPPAALVVGTIHYTESELGALSARQRSQLADLTAFGLVIAGGEEARLTHPFIALEEQSLLLGKLALEIAVREMGVDEASLEASYAAAPEYELTVRHLVVLSERWRSGADRELARRKASAALARVRAGEDFSRVAGEVSEEPGAADRGGLLRPGRQGTWVPEFWNAALALAVSETSDVVETQYGFHVLHLEDRHPVPLAEVRGRALARLVDPATANARAEAWVARQVEDLRIDPQAIGKWRLTGEADTLSLVEWPGGSYTAAMFVDYLQTLDAEATARLEAAPDSAFTVIVGIAARNRMLAGHADILDVKLGDEEKAPIERQWQDRVQGWARLLRFRSGMQQGALKAAALAGLTDGSQAVQIGRSEVLALSPSLRRLYRVQEPRQEN